MAGRRTRIALITVGLLLAAGASLASDGLPKEVRRGVERFLAACWGEENVEWEATGSYRGLELAAGSDFRIEGPDRPRGVELLHLVLLEEGEIVRRYPISLRVRPYARVPVVEERVKRRTPVTGRNLRWERREVTRVRGDWPRSLNELVQRPFWLRRTMRTGSILTWRDVEAIPAVVRGERVDVVSRSGSVAVTIAGIAMQDGRVGEVIRVENPDHRSILRARVEDEATVTVLAGSVR